MAEMARPMTLRREEAVAALSILAIISYTRLGLSFTVAEGKPLEETGKIHRS